MAFVVDWIALEFKTTATDKPTMQHAWTVLSSVILPTRCSRRSSLLLTSTPALLCVHLLNVCAARLVPVDPSSLIEVNKKDIA
jgi:hypothetical protein